MALSALATAAMFALLAFGLVSLRPGGGDASARLGLGRGRLPWAALLLAIAGTLALSNLLDSVIVLLQQHETGSLGQLRRRIAGARGPQLSWVLLGVALAAGVAEELFFRGYVQRGLERRLAGRPGGALAALVVAAAAFGIVHLDPVHTPAAFVLGLYLGALARLADSVRPVIACHVVNNALAVVDAAYGLSLPFSGRAGMGLAAALAAAGLLAAAWLRQDATAAPPRPPEAATGAPPIDRP